MSGCATMQDVVKAKQNGSEGTTQTYNVNEAQAWEIAKQYFFGKALMLLKSYRTKIYVNK